MFSRVYSVEHVSFKLLKSNPPQLVVSATGLTSSSGWSDPELATWMYIKPPADGILDLDFIARAPTGMSLPYLAPIAATLSIVAPDWLRGVRVHAANNAIVEGDKTGGGQPLVAGDDPVPWPWSAQQAVR